MCMPTAFAIQAPPKLLKVSAHSRTLALWQLLPLTTHLIHGNIQRIVGHVDDRNGRNSIPAHWGAGAAGAEGQLGALLELELLWLLVLLELLLGVLLVMWRYLKAGYGGLQGGPSRGVLVSSSRVEAGRVWALLGREGGCGNGGGCGLRVRWWVGAVVDVALIGEYRLLLLFGALACSATEKCMSLPYQRATLKCCNYCRGPFPLG